jgi:hypothetical protein
MLGSQAIAKIIRAFVTERAGNALELRIRKARSIQSTFRDRADQAIARMANHMRDEQPVVVDRAAERKSVLDHQGRPFCVAGLRGSHDVGSHELNEMTDKQKVHHPGIRHPFVPAHGKPRPWRDNAWKSIRYFASCRTKRDQSLERGLIDGFRPRDVTTHHERS